jgi:hypothetical protein
MMVQYKYGIDFIVRSIIIEVDRFNGYFFDILKNFVYIKEFCVYNYLKIQYYFDNNCYKNV